MEEKEETTFLTNLAPSITEEHRNIKMDMERFEIALKTIVTCKKCTDNYRKKIVQLPSTRMAETTERNQNTRVVHHVLQKERL